MAISLLSNHEIKLSGSGEATWGIPLSDIATKINNAVPDNAEITKITLNFSGKSYNNNLLGALNEYAICGLTNSDSEAASNTNGGTGGTNLFKYGPYEIGGKSTVNLQSQSVDITKYFNARAPHSVQNTNYSRLTLAFTSKNYYNKTHTVSLSLDVTYEVPKYTVTWKNHDGTVLETDTGVTSGTTPTYNGSTPTKTGYTFSGWSPAVGAISGNTTYTAQFTENKYTIAFNGNGNTGGSMSSITNVGYDDSKTLTANAFTKTGYTFNGWNTKADGSGTSYADKASVSKLTATNGATVTLYAKWKANSYTIKFNANGGSGSMSDLAMTYDTAKNLTANSFTRTGYDFLGWSTSSSATSATYADKASVKNLATSGSVTLYAVWKIKTFTVTVVASPTEAGTVSGGGNYDYNKTATLTATAKTGWKFKQWNDGNTSNPRTVTVTAATTYTATFEKLTYAISTAVSPSSSGTVTGAGTYEHGSTATLKATPNTGYKFVKWSDGNTSATRTVTVTGAATYTATFEKLKYTVTWKNDDGTVLETDNNVEYGTTPTYNGATPTKASTAQHAYTFSGWSPAISAVTGNVTYTAQFTATVRKYTVKWYNYDGTLLETDAEVPYGTKPTYNGATPTKPSDDYYNYGFVGWSPSISEGIQGDKNFTAQFAQTDRYYTVRWVNASAVQGVEGALLETDEVKFNTQPDYNGATPKHPKQDTDPALNYDFIGWSAKVTDPAKPDTELEKVKGDITYTAIYETTPKLYAITVILFNSQSTDIYEYGTELTIEAPEIVDFHRFVKWSDGDTRPSRTVQVTGEATYSAEYERIAIPIKANLEQITGCYLVPDTNTIVYVINGTVPTVKIGRESVDGWSFLVSNSVPENGYPLKKLFITENSGVTTRVY